ncbi:MAG: hypothetical protein GEU98_12380 [Pseudonocardiaceae bacterium]|nr:hypothetical protein [Pseudonocardiaceae bacterium]
MLRIFHVPSHLSYAAKLTSSEFAPVASPTGGPLRLSELAELRCWGFFDVLHVHTVELATADDLERVAARAENEGKGLVFTAHDLAPNIEDDRSAFDRKTALLVRRARVVMTLTTAAAEQVAMASGVTVSSLRVVPHGAALPLSLVGSNSVGAEVAAFGALRPNRDFLSVVRAWRLLPAPRPPLRLLVRSLTHAEEQRYTTVLDELAQAERADPELTITTTPDVMPPDDLVSWCRPVSVLVLPYTKITHSGQLELARDLGLRLVAPDVPTLRSQVDEGPRSSVEWFALSDLAEPRRFATHLQHALSLPAPATGGTAVHDYRAAEHTRLLDAHRDAYLSATSPIKV